MLEKVRLVSTEQTAISAMVVNCRHFQLLVGVLSVFLGQELDFQVVASFVY